MHTDPDIASGATIQGTQRYRDRFPNLPDHFRQRQDWWLSSIGLGTYLGDPDAETDAAYATTVQRAVESGINVIDTAINYRFQRSERSIGSALISLFESGRAQRDEIVIATKGGYIPYDGSWPSDPDRYLRETFIDTGLARLKDFVDGHCMTPEYLYYQIEQSRRNLGVDCIDIYYLHNPESQLDAIPRTDFRGRLRAAFEFLEERVDQGWIQYYGTATWNGYRASPKSSDYLSLDDVLAIAREVRGINHHCRFIQLPFNLALLEALTLRNQRVGGELMTTLEAAGRLGATVMCSAALFQSRLLSQIPDALRGQFGRLETDAQRAIQFARSAPGVASALVGTRQVKHLDENIATAQSAPLEAAAFKRLFAQR